MWDCVLPLSFFWYVISRSSTAIDCMTNVQVSWCSSRSEQLPTKVRDCPPWSVDVNEFKIWFIRKQIGHSYRCSNACLGCGDIEPRGSVALVRNMALGSAKTGTRDEHLCTPVFCSQEKLLPVKVRLLVLVPSLKGLRDGCVAPSFERLQ
jgi:hypothetical protein